MASVDDVYGQSPYLRPIDLPEEPAEYTIEAVDVDDFGHGPRIVLTLQGVRRPLILSRMNARVIEVIHGSEISGWVGKKIWVSRAYARVGGDVVPIIKIWYSPAAAAGDGGERRGKR